MLKTAIYFILIADDLGSLRQCVMVAKKSRGDYVGTRLGTP